MTYNLNKPWRGRQPISNAIPENQPQNSSIATSATLINSSRPESSKVGSLALKLHESLSPQLSNFFPVPPQDNRETAAQEPICILCGDEVLPHHFTCDCCTQAINRENSMDKITDKNPDKRN